MNVDLFKILWFEVFCLSLFVVFEKKVDELHESVVVYCAAILELKLVHEPFDKMRGI